jgi:hypothetical protein
MVNLLPIYIYVFLFFYFFNYYYLFIFPLKGLLGWRRTCFLISSKSLLKTLWRAHWELVGVDLQPQGFTTNPMCNVIHHLPPSLKGEKKEKP